MRSPLNRGRISGNDLFATLILKWMIRRAIRITVMVDVAQLAEHRVVAPVAVGSNPSIHPTIKSRG